MSDDTIPPCALERLQARAIAFRDRVDKLLAILYDSDESEQPARDNWPQLNDMDAASHALAEILELRARRSEMPEIPDWFGPMEQLSNQVASNGAELVDAANRIVSEIEAHNAHSDLCRCAELRDIFVGHLRPALDECDDLLEAIEKLRSHVLLHPESEPPSG